MMSEQQLNGGMDQAKGRIKDAAGALMGDLRTQAAGKAQQLRGQAESLFGDAVERFSKLAADRPAVALGGALGIGVVLGLILARNS
jgi:uncharacterized protein YjbJ (UPF0337 family)